MSDYPLKSTGETYLRMQISRFKSFKTKMKNLDKDLNHSILSIPLEQAEEIVNKHKENTNAIRSAKAILEELEIMLADGYENYSPTKLRLLCKRALLNVNKIK